LVVDAASNFIYFTITKQGIQLILIMLVRTGVCVEEDPPARLGDHMSILVLK